MYHSKNWPISSSLFTLLVCSCCSGLSWSSVFLWCWLLLLFHFSHYWSGPSPFFSWCIWLKMQQFYLFKEPAFSLTDLSYFYLVSISFSSAVCMIFFLLLTLGFVCCSFYSSFRCKVRVFIQYFSCWDRLISLKTFLLKFLLLHHIIFL